MMQSNERRAVVVGAGIGGLAVGIALQRAGYAVTIFERADDLRDVGFALLLAPNAMRALRILGVREAVVEQGLVATTGELRDASGRTLRHVDVSSMTEVLGEPTVCVLRPVLYEALLGALGTDAVRTGARVLATSQDEGSATVELDGGERLTADLVVGADGIHSTLRRAIRGEQPLRASGLVAFRGVVRGLPATGGAQYFGRGIEAALTGAGGDASYWYVSMKAARLPDAGLDSPRDGALAALGEGFDPALVAAVRATAPEDARRDELYDLPAEGAWHDGRIALLGDAAHPMLPHAGQGAAQALEDAVVLGRCLAEDGSVVEALARYEAVRRPRAARIVRLARRNAQLGSVDAAVACALRDLAMRLLPTPLLLRQLLSVNRVDLEG